MTDSPADHIAQHLNELHTEVTTREQIPRFRTISRGRTAALVTDFVPHDTASPGLLDQLAIISKTGPRAIAVEIYTVKDGKRVKVRTEQRQILGLVDAGGALPGGSPGWDADGALAPITAGGDPAESEPITDAWHVREQILHDLAQLEKELKEQGHRGSLVSIALADERTGRHVAARLRSMVSRARIAAGYDAPIVPLRDVCCPECGGVLNVREDASSAVWCSAQRVEGPAWKGEAWPLRASCGATWPRGGWVKLLETAEPPEPLVAARGTLRSVGMLEGSGGRP